MMVICEHMISRGVVLLAQRRGNDDGQLPFWDANSAGESDYLTRRTFMIPQQLLRGHEILRDEGERMSSEMLSNMQVQEFGAHEYYKQSSRLLFHPRDSLSAPSFPSSCQQSTHTPA